jgi:hypothetical protein
MMSALIKQENLKSFDIIDKLDINPEIKLSLIKQLSSDIKNYAESTSIIDYSPRNITELEDWAIKFSRSDMCPKHLKGKPLDIVITIQTGHELKLKPMQAIRTIYVVNGIASTYGVGNIALVRESGLCEYIKEWYEGKIEDETFIAYCEIKRKGEPPVVKDFDYKRAKRAKLITKPGVWQEYPDQMIQWRATGKACKLVFADVLWGLTSEYDAQDIIDHENERAKLAKDITPLKKGNQGVRQLLEISEEKVIIPEPQDSIEEEELANSAEIEILQQLVIENGLITQQQAWLDKANVKSLSELKQKTVRALIDKYSGGNANE